jgi:DNA repair protein RadC
MLLREARVTYVSRQVGSLKRKPLADSQAAYDIVKNIFEPGDPQERFVVLLLNAKHRYEGHVLVSLGTLDSTVVHPRDVFRPAVLQSSAAVVLAHNHPSGDPTPSAEDLAVTKRLISAGEILGIDVLDHLIIGDDSWCSLRDRGEL